MRIYTSKQFIISRISKTIFMVKTFTNTPPLSEIWLELVKAMEDYKNALALLDFTSCYDYSGKRIVKFEKIDDVFYPAEDPTDKFRLYAKQSLKQ